MGLAAGIIILLISFAHILYGEKKQIPDLKQITQDPILIGLLRIMIYQGGIILLAVGILQVLVSIHFVVLTGISVYFPVGIVLLNFLTSLLIIVVFHREVFKVTGPQFVIFSVIIVLLFLSI